MAKPVKKKARERAPRTRAPRADGRILVSASRFAEICGVHHNTIGNWIKDGLPATRVRRDTQIDVAAGVLWVRDHDRRELEREREAIRAGRDSGASKAAKVAAEARLRELDVAEREGRLILAADVAARWSQIAVAVREAVMSVPGISVQSGIVEPTQEAELETICRDALAGLVAEPEAAVA